MHLTSVTFEITNACNLRCKMCTIWQERPIAKLSLSDIVRVINSFPDQQFSVSITGGECYMHPEIKEILTYLQQCTLVSHVSVVSNGYAYERIQSILDSLEGDLSKFEFDYSVDGMQTQHEFQRGVVGSFDRTKKSLLYTRKKYPKNPVLLKCTLNRHNYTDVDMLYDFCLAHNIIFLPKIIESGTSNYYERLEHDKDIYLMSVEDKKNIISTLMSLIERAQGKNIQPRDILKSISYLKGTLCIEKCRTPKHTLFVTSKGDVHPCLYYDAVANIHEVQWYKKLLNDAHKKMIVEGYQGTCPTCIAYHGYLRSINERRT